MSTKATPILAVLLGVQILLGAAIWSSQDDRGAFQAEERLLSFEIDEIDEIAIEEGDQRVALKRVSGEWQLPDHFAFPADDYGFSLKDQFPEWKQAVIDADGFVIVTPEYNHGYPGVLKSLMDTMLSDYRRKAVALVGTSRGGWGGTRVIEALVPMVRAHWCVSN